MSCTALPNALKPAWNSPTPKLSIFLISFSIYSVLPCFHQVLRGCANRGDNSNALCCLKPSMVITNLIDLGSNYRILWKVVLTSWFMCKSCQRPRSPWCTFAFIVPWNDNRNKIHFYVSWNRAAWGVFSLNKCVWGLKLGQTRLTALLFWA